MNELSQTTALASTFELADFCSGYGQKHSDRTGPDARPYVGIRWQEILEMVENPPQVDKAEGQWAIFSDLHSRAAAEQRKEGTYHAAWADLDDAPVTFAEAVHSAAEALPCDVHGYTSRSATEEKQKARLLMPLAEPCNGEEFAMVQEVINDRLEAAGVAPDRVTERVNQLCYLPNRGEFYESDSIEWQGPLDWRTEFAQEIAAKREQLAKEEEALRIAQEEAQRKRQERLEVQQQTGQVSPIDTFNEAYRAREMWESYGARGRGRRLLSPLSSSGSPAITVDEESGLWYSHHGSDREAGIGQPGKAGGCWGDAFDLYVHFDHGGDFNAALKAAGEMFTINGVTINKHNQRAYMEAEARTAAAADFEGAGSWWDDVADPSPTGAQEAPDTAPEQAEEDAPPSLLEMLDKHKARHLLATTPAPQRYVVEGMLPEPVTAAIVAPGSTGKSFWLMQLAACVASGTPFMGQAIPNPGAVLMLGAEDDRDEMARRLHSIVREYTWDGNGLDAELVGERFYAVSRLGANNMLTHMDGRNVVRMNGKDGRPDNIGDIIKAAQAIPGLRLIIIDPISRFRAGDENDNEAATRFVEALEQIRKETGVTVLCAHHSRKGSDGKEADSIRGASALVDAFRFAATLAKVPSVDAKKMSLSEDDAKNLVQFNVVKSNYRTDLDNQWLRRGVGGVLKVTEPPKGLKEGVADQKGQERYSAVLPQLKELVGKKDADGRPLTRRKLRSDYGGTANTFGVGKDTLESIANRAITEGVLKLHEESGTLHLW